jgi:hypothetical protein
MRARRHTKLVREGRYAAEVDMELIEAEDGWDRTCLSTMCSNRHSSHGSTFTSTWNGVAVPIEPRHPERLETREPVLSGLICVRTAAPRGGGAVVREIEIAS